MVTGARQEREAVRPGEDAQRPEVSVVIPCLDEVATLGRCIEKAQGAFRELGIAGEVVVADNGSADGSQELATSLGARVVPVHDKGYGAALMGGIAAARAPFVIMGDADDTYDFGAISPFLEKLREGYDVVVGNRFEGGIEPGAMPWLHRYVGTPVLTTASRWFFRSPCGDINCGLRGLRRDAVLELDLRATGMEFASEMIVKASVSGMRIGEVPTTLAPDLRGRARHLRTWRDGWRHMRLLLLYSPNWLFAYPGLLLMAVGLLVMLVLLPGERTVGGLVLDVHTLLYAAVTVIAGFQAVLFSFLARVFAISEGLLPAAERVGPIPVRLRPETGLLAGLVLVAIGLGGAVYTFVLWGSKSFGDLDYTSTMRVVIPSGMLLAIGFQTLLASFFLATLQLRRRH